MDTDTKKLVQKLREERKIQKLTYEDIQEKTGLAKSTIHRFFTENLDKLNPRFYTIRCIQDCLLNNIKIDTNTDNQFILFLEEQISVKDRQIDRLLNILTKLSENEGKIYNG